MTSVRSFTIFHMSPGFHVSRRSSSWVWESSVTTHCVRYRALPLSNIWCVNKRSSGCQLQPNIIDKRSSFIVYDLVIQAIISKWRCQCDFTFHQVGKKINKPEAPTGGSGRAQFTPIIVHDPELWLKNVDRACIVANIVSEGGTLEGNCG